MYLIVILSDDYHKLFRKMTTLEKKFTGQPHRSLTVASPWNATAKTMLEEHDGDVGKTSGLQVLTMFEAGKFRTIGNGPIGWRIVLI